MSEPTRGHLAVPLVPAARYFVCDVGHHVRNSDIPATCPAMVKVTDRTPELRPGEGIECGEDIDFEMVEPATIPAHSDEWIRQTVERVRRNPKATHWRERAGWRAACDAILAALDADQ